MNQAAYLVQTTDGLLHCYWNPSTLLADLGRYPSAEVQEVYRLIEGVTLAYEPLGSRPLRTLSDDARAEIA